MAEGSLADLSHGEDRQDISPEKVQETSGFYKDILVHVNVREA